jgi:hypothetical protein
MKLDPGFKNDHPSKYMGGTPATVKQQLWDSMYKEFFKFEGSHYYIDKRHESPFGFEYDFWSYNGVGVIQGRVTGEDLPRRMTTYINRKKKMKRILGKIN